MKLRFIANAGFVVTLADGRTIVTDPWLTEGAYYGSWFNYPPVPEEVADELSSMRPTWIWVSHVHPDHLDPDTLRRFDNAPVLIGELGHRHLRRSVESAGATDITELPLDVTADLGGIEITVVPQFAAAGGGYDDEVAYDIDTSLVVRDVDGRILLHVVDNPMRVEDAERFVDRFGHPDIAVLPYSGASFYPHAFAYSDAEKAKRAADLRDRTLDEFIALAEVLRPGLTVPAAGSYVMGGAIADYSRWLHQATPAAIRARWAESSVRSAPLVCMAPGEVLDSEADNRDRHGQSSFTEDDRLAYALSLRSKELAHERVRIPPEFRVPWARLVRRARANLWAVQTARDLFPPIDVEIRLQPAENLVCDGFSFRWAMDAEDPQPRHDEVVIFTIDPALLLMVLNGAAIWNNVEIGALVNVERHPDAYNPTVHSLMSYFALV